MAELGVVRNRSSVFFSSHPAGICSQLRLDMEVDGRAMPFSHRLILRHGQVKPAPGGEGNDMVRCVDAPVSATLRVRRESESKAESEMGTD